MLNRKHNLKSGKSKDKKKGFETEKQDRKPKERENISGKKNAIEYFDVFLFMKQKQWRKKRKERDKNKKQKESKRERQEGRKKEKNNRETEKEKQKKGEAKKG